VLFRTEEIHRASGEDDVVPPVGGGNCYVEDVLVGDRALAADVDRDRVAAIRAGARDVAVDMERGRDPEGVPGAVSIPGAAVSPDSVRRGLPDRLAIQISVPSGAELIACSSWSQWRPLDVSGSSSQLGNVGSSSSTKRR
jgi:hypothetical protein